MRMSTKVAIAVSLSVFTPMASMGQTDWKTIHTTGDPDITMDIPSDVIQETDRTLVDPKKGDLMVFFAKAEEDDLECFLHRDGYSKEDGTHKFWVTALASPKSAMLCNDSDQSVSQFVSWGSQPMTSNRFVAAACASIYTDNNAKKPGVVMSVMTIAAPRARYRLTCQVNAEDQSAAEIDWQRSLKDVVTHIQASLKLPVSKK